ncbi:hypothetical protein OG218_00395 [Kineococcus sp. NBC_00420]|uniref:hypothetical protein n=1 Tax=Kineococcus sp. NBC_00420 TaxID=2903564 RepID=UPI002E1BEED8
MPARLLYLLGAPLAIAGVLGLLLSLVVRGLPDVGARVWNGPLALGAAVLLVAGLLTVVAARLASRSSRSSLEY